MAGFTSCFDLATEETEHCIKKDYKISDPPYIRYLLAPTTRFTVYFIVGNPALDEQEKIGASKLNLLAHSVVFRKILNENTPVDGCPVEIPDIRPDIFRHLLRFMYGYNSVPTLTMAEAINLMHAATEYMVEGLNERLVPHIVPQLTVQNVFLSLKQPACFQHHKVKNAIVEIIQENTEALLSNPEFLDLDHFGLERILEQKALEVTEIQLWKAVLRWAIHNLPSFNAEMNRNKRPKSEVRVKLHTNLPNEIAGSSAELQSLRDLLSKPLKYIRFCTMSWRDLTKEVILTGILTEYEVYMITRTYGSNVKQNSLTTVCNEIKTRNLITKNSLGSKNNLIGSNRFITHLGTSLPAVTTFPRS